MKNFKNVLKNLLVMMFAVAALPVATASATPTILVDPYDNIPLEGATTLSVTGAGLVPGARVNMVQRSFGPSGAVEQRHLASVIVDASGNIATTVSVTYDVRSDQTQLDYCDNDSSLGRLCDIRFFYTENYGDVSPEIMTQKIYFGVSGPVVAPPAPTEPLSKDDCRDDKWSIYTDLGFKNQGACVSYVATKH